jgi:hypothetical protein
MSPNAGTADEAMTAGSILEKMEAKQLSAHIGGIV